MASSKYCSFWATQDTKCGKPATWAVGDELALCDGHYDYSMGVFGAVKPEVQADLRVRAIR